MCIRDSIFVGVERIHPAQTLRVVIGMLVHIVVINILSNVSKQLLADLIRCLLYTSRCV